MIKLKAYRYITALLVLLLLSPAVSSVGLASANALDEIFQSSHRPFKHWKVKRQVSSQSILETLRGGGSDAKKQETTTAADGGILPSWFRPNVPKRTRWLSFWLMIWNCAALTDCIAYTFFPEHSLNRYLEGEWGPHALAQTRMLANCQAGLIASIFLIALQGDEHMIRTALRGLIFVTVGAFRAIHAGIKEGTISPITDSAWASALSLPPLLFLCYFAFVF